ncbi:Neoverrucotoxin subunit alpha [Takifugu flavidus]|uniref:Neoverrucotoxin subunit alpha n=1 Tax=Takifugu flavidus TaxID=433684 RepID=A0A5C6MHB6_9TELE|nr:Neoverrucotoxin subunit alpha [Takifugu flavidus]
MQVIGLSHHSRRMFFSGLSVEVHPTHLKELDLSFNHPGDDGTKQLSAVLEDPELSLEVLRLDHCGKERLKSGVKKYHCELSVDTNTVHRSIQLSNNRVMRRVVEDQPYPDHPERFQDCIQLLCSNSLTGRCYWERVAVYVNYPAGTVTFYRFTTDTLVHLHTFKTTFTEPLFPGFGFSLWGSTFARGATLSAPPPPTARASAACGLHPSQRCAAPPPWRGRPRPAASTRLNAVPLRPHGEGVRGLQPPPVSTLCRSAPTVRASAVCSLHPSQRCVPLRPHGEGTPSHLERSVNICDGFEEFLCETPGDVTSVTTVSSTALIGLKNR